MTNFLTKYATWKSILILFGLNLAINILIFPLFQATSPSAMPLDLQFSYSPEKAYQLLANFSPDELKKYMLVELTVDVAYPVVYALLLSFLIFKLSQKTALAMLPIIVLFLDYLENIGIVTMIHYYPQKLTSIANVTSLFTSLKWSLVVVSIVLILVLAVKKMIVKKQTS